MLAEAIAHETGLAPSVIEQLARSASHFYKVYAIDKRHGDQKRIIQQPSRALKFLQRWIVANVIQDVPVHSAAAAYVTGSSVKKHAEKHVKNNYLLRLDFHQFFPSIKGSDIRRHLVKNRPYLHFVEDTDIELLVAAVTRSGGLVIGAPSSPALSNQIMFQFDDLLHSWCTDSTVTYTRYADDLYFSTRTPDVLRLAQEKVVELLGSIEYPKLSLNDDKTVHTSRKKKRLVTGLSLSSDGKVSLGREKKRKIRSMIHKHKVVAGLESKERAYLAGYLAYAHSVEPQFIASLERKYGSETMQIVMTMSQPPRSGH
jgi:hypothetical protein